MYCPGAEGAAATKCEGDQLTAVAANPMEAVTLGIKTTYDKYLALVKGMTNNPACASLGDCHAFYQGMIFTYLKMEIDQNLPMSMTYDAQSALEKGEVPPVKRANKLYKELLTEIEPLAKEILRNKTRTKKLLSRVVIDNSKANGWA
jgi:hypothetical protein